MPNLPGDEQPKARCVTTDCRNSGNGTVRNGVWYPVGITPIQAEPETTRTGETVGIQPRPRTVEMSHWNRGSSCDTASGNNCKVCMSECPIKIRYIRDPRKFICRVTYTTRDNMKYRFYEELEHEFDKFPKYYNKILLGDFNAKIRWKDIFKLTLGNESFARN
jgi:hypothetical protein